ncbi:hypothetical protein DCAR_0833061 [Daucus carota subsp. sativus]|uniref:P-type ATPase N-terminal domain-containing protein n=1 Tax=Daucus carota subsp. sativus TaxID=79200 RepID=A0AAF1BFE7_DAUCS|nr:hypothetical protein DCAR_0833061 [Daucus carota subsp. sativus]
MAHWRNTHRSRNGAAYNTLTPSRTIQLGRVTPQAPGNRTYCGEFSYSTYTYTLLDTESMFVLYTIGCHFLSNFIMYKFVFCSHLGCDFQWDFRLCSQWQFRRLANCYFLMISLLSFTPVSPVSPYTNVAPLAIVLIVSLIKEAFEDWSINNSAIDLLQDQKWESVPWKKLQVGDIVRLLVFLPFYFQDGLFPADLLFLATSNPDGVC